MPRTFNTQHLTSEAGVMEWWSFGVMGGGTDGKIFNHGTVSHRRRAQMDTDFKNRLKDRSVEALKRGSVAPLELGEFLGAGAINMSRRWRWEVGGGCEIGATKLNIQ